MGEHNPFGDMHATTIITVRKGAQVVMAGDGQVSLGQTVMKGNARKVRRIGKDNNVIAGFAGATADAFTLLERLEALPPHERVEGLARRHGHHELRRDTSLETSTAARAKPKGSFR